MSIRKSSARTAVNSGVNAAAAATINQITVAPATATTVAGGGTLGGVTISNVAITDSTFANVLSGDTAVSSAGGFVRITGTGFKTNANVLLGSTALANTFVSATQINANVPASSAGLYQFTIFNTDGSGCNFTPGLTISGPPTWTTTSYSATSLSLGNIQLLASGDAPLTYYIQPGSANPQNLAVNSAGYLSGTVAAEGAYTITVIVDDAQNQSTQADITVTVSTSDSYFNLTTLALPADGTNNANNQSFIDSSTNNFTVTRNGNATQGTFSPFSQTGWSGYFNGADYLTVPNGSAFAFGTGDFTVEGWFYFSSVTNGIADLSGGTTGYWDWLILSGTMYWQNARNTANLIIVALSNYLNQWVHFAVVRNSGTTRIYQNGVQIASASDATNYSGTAGVLNIGRESANPAYTTGYISNFRLVKGTAVYTSAFTPSTSPLTAIANTSLLTCQSNRFVDIAGALAITTTGTPQIQAFSPFAPTAIYNASTNGGSGYFDGTGDYLSVAANAAFQFGTGNFTFEYWWYPTSFAGDTTISMGYLSPGSYLVQNASDGKPYFYTGTGGLLFTATTGYTLYAWNHLAVSRSGTTLSMFLNGARVGTATNSTNFNANFALGIGAPVTGEPEDAIGHMSSVRLVKGTAVYDPTLTTLTVPTSPLTAIANTSLLLNFTNAGIVDATGKNTLETVNQAQLSTAVKKFGSASIVLDGVDDYIVMPYSPLFNLGTGAFTIEGWVYFNVLSGNRMIFDTYTSAALGGGYQLYWRSTGTSITLYGNGVVIAQSSFTGHVTGTWYHIACTRDTSGNVRIFVDGTKYADTPYTTALNIATTARPAVGIQVATLTNDLDGYVDDFRVTLGYARYTANFTAPTQANKLQ